MNFDQSELQDAITQGERKLALKRQKKRRDRKRLLLAGALLALLLPFAAIAGVVAGRAPSAPSLVVTWPKPKVKQVLSPGQTLLARPGQPFLVSLTNPEAWQVTWKTADLESSDPEFTWAASGQKSQLLARCRPLASGWQSLFAWTWPTREIALQSLAARQEGDYGRALDAGTEGVWVYPHILASGMVRFDERALPLLASAIELVPQNALSHQLAGTTPAPTPRLWQLVADFDGQISSAAPSDTAGTFAALHAPKIETALAPIAARIVQKSPTTSVKWILRLDKDVPEGIVRLAFDGKAQHLAWVRRAGQSAGQPLTGWENGTAPTVLPALPRG